MKKYSEEAKTRFGGSEAFLEYEKKTENYSADKWQQINDGLQAVIARFAECRKNGHAADSAEAQALVEALQSFITENYYTCTDEILRGLGQMYVCDERFKANIDRNGEGTALFIREAIKVHA